MVVIAGLCEVLKASPIASELFLRVNAECVKLWTISAKNTFREADFMKVTRYCHVHPLLAHLLLSIARTLRMIIL